MIAPDPLRCFAERWRAPDPQTAMQLACSELLRRAGQERPPIALAPVWHRLGAKVSYDEHHRDGSLAASGDTFLVRVRAQPPRYRLRPDGPVLPVTWRRSRFSLAHELGHVLLLQGIPAAVQPRLADPELHEEVEQLCNLAAAELLMPAPRFGLELRAAGITPTGLRRLYDDYLVSWPALMVRIAERLSANVTLWRGGVRDRDGELMRVTQSFGVPGDLRLPPGLSEGYLSQPLVRIALRDGIAACRRLTSDHRPMAEPSPALACAMPSKRLGQSRLPDWRGARVQDEAQGRDQVVLLRLTSASLRDWMRLRRCPALDARRQGMAPAPFAMALDAA